MLLPTLIVNVAEPEPPAIVELLKDAVGPPDGVTLADRYTVPVNPFDEATLMVDVPEAPVAIEREVGLTFTL